MSLLKVVSSKAFHSITKSSRYTVVLTYNIRKKETSTFINFVNNLGTGPSPKHRQGNLWREPSHLKCTYFLDCLFNGTKNRRLWGSACIDSHLVPKFSWKYGALPSWYKVLPSVCKILMCSSASAWWLVIVFHPSLILGTDSWQTGPCNELPLLWHSSPAFLSTALIQVLPELGLVSPWLVFLVGTKSPQSL